MRARRAIALLCIHAAAAGAAEVAAEPPVDLAITMYRAPSRARGSIELDELGGFALVSETRMVRLPPGVSRLRFDGVADGIEAQSAIISGLPQNLIEKNRDAKLLSPSALLAATVDRSVELLRTNRKTGETERSSGTILSDAGGGVVFKTARGTEALRCSGLAETFSFESGAALGAQPSLSVLVHTRTALIRKITLSYLSRGFDWAADYSATLALDARSMDLGAWVTLANSNATGFPSARTQVVAGRVNRENDTVEPLDLGGPILATCWPRGSTSDTPAGELRFAKAAAMRSMAPAMMTGTLQQVTATALHTVAEEQLGDLKLYRVPERTTVASRQSKQVRLLDRCKIPVAIVYHAALAADETRTSFAAERVLRTVNDKANHLGLPLPSGSIAVFAWHGGQRLLLHESSVRDLALNEEVEFELGSSADVQVAVVHEKIQARHEQMERVRLSNARAEPIRIELPILLDEGATVIRADHPLGNKNGRPILRLTVPARGSSTLRYVIGYQKESSVR